MTTRGEIHSKRVIKTETIESTFSGEKENSCYTYPTRQTEPLWGGRGGRIRL